MCDFFKISSYDILRNNFISKILNHRKLTLISTGMSSKLELSNLNKLLKKIQIIIQSSCIVGAFIHAIPLLHI